MSGIGSSNCSKSNNSSSNVGRPEMAQSYTNLGLTQDSGMEGTMKNLTFLARYGGCAIAKKSMCQGGLQIWAWGTTETPPNALPGSWVWGPTWNHCSTKQLVPSHATIKTRTRTELGPSLA